MAGGHLAALFEPGSIVFAGASGQPGSIGAVIARHLITSGFAGDVMFLNPNVSELAGHKVWPDVESLPRVPDLAVIATPPATVPDLVGRLGARGTKAAIVITAGFAETGEAGRKLQQDMLDAARTHGLRILGPNCFGVVVPRLGLRTNFERAMPRPGKIAVVSQSGAIVAAMSDWAVGRNIGLSHLVALGGMADIDFGDVIGHLAGDDTVEAIILYIEAVTDAAKFMTAASAASRRKPVVVLKTGRSPAGAAAAASHTGALTGSDAVYDAAFRRAGLCRVDCLDDLYAAAEMLALMQRPAGARLAIISNAGGLAVMAADTTARDHVQLAVLAPETIARLNQVLPPTWPGKNPVDIIGGAPAERYLAALDIVADDAGVDAILLIHCPTAIQSSSALAEAVVGHLETPLKVPLFACWAGGVSVGEGRSRLSAAGIANFDTPERAVRAFAQIVIALRLGEHRLTLAPIEFKADRSVARQAMAATLGADRSWLDAADVQRLLQAYGIPVPRAIICRDEDEAAAAAESIGGRVALKVMSADILHKSDVGGVALGLESGTAVRDAARSMRERLVHIEPAPRIEGFLVQAMVERPGAVELLAGLSTDPTFGPVIVFGHGGKAVEVIADRALGFPPLDMTLAYDMMRGTRVYRLLVGYRDVVAVDLDAIASTLVRLSQMVIDHPQIQEMDLNPLLADETGVIAVDARVRISPASNAGGRRLALMPSGGAPSPG